MTSNQAISRHKGYILAFFCILASIVVSQAQPSVSQTPFITHILDDPSTFEVDLFLRGTWNGESIQFFIQYNEETNVSSLDSNDIEFIGLSGDATGKMIPVSFVESAPFFGGQTRATYEVGPFDATANGTYAFRLKVNEVHDGGDPPTSIPEREFFQFVQDISEPVGGVSDIFFSYAYDNEGNLTYGVQGDFGLEYRDLGIYYDQEVDWESIDINDISIVGIDGDALGHTYPISVEGSSFFELSKVQFVASLRFGPLQVEHNGTYAVRLAPNEVFVKGDPPTALEGQDIFTFVQNVTNPFQAIFEGRAFLETGTPKFEDDGWETDPGLDLNFLIEAPIRNGYGYHRISFTKSIVGNKPTGYESTLVDVVEALDGNAGSGGFHVTGDHSLIFPVGAAIKVSESNGYDGTYTVSSVNISANVTQLGVEEAVPASGTGGKLARAYTANVTIDGEEIPVSISGVESQTFQQLIFQLNAILGDRGYAAIPFETSLYVESPSYGSSSTVVITEPGGINSLFSNLPDYHFQESVPGSDEFYSLFQNEFYSEGNLEQDIGRFQFTLVEPGIYRIRVWAEEVFDVNLQETLWLPPDPEWIVQALGDPTRIGSPKDYLMYVRVVRNPPRQVVVLNFPFIEATASPDAFTANDDFATAPGTADRIKINVLANDIVEDGVTKDQLVVIDISTPIAGGRVAFQDSNVTYWPPKNFIGTDKFTYTLTDGISGTDTAMVSVSVRESPVPDGQRAMLNLLLQLFGSSTGGNFIFEFFNKHISEFDYIIMDQGEDPVAAKANDKVPSSRLQVGGTADTQARWNAILDMAEPGITATLAGQGDSIMVTQELVDILMATN